MSIAQQNIFLGVNEIHTLQLPDDSAYCFVGMEVQGRVKPEPDNIVLIMAEEQIYEMAEYFKQRSSQRREINEYLIKTLLETATERGLNIHTPSENEWLISNLNGSLGFTYNKAFITDSDGKVIKNNEGIENFFKYFE